MRVGKSIISRIRDVAQEGTFYVTDLRQVRKLYAAWTTTFPFIRPHYAIKCNPDSAIIHELARLGASFDCASLNEIKLLLTRHRVKSDQIIFANPAKIPQHMQYASQQGVHLTTFDSVAELEKIAKWYPEARCLLRFRVENPEAKCNLGAKYGATSEEIADLLNAAKQFRTKMVGVAFHIGSGGRSYDNVMNEAMTIARDILEAAAREGVCIEKKPIIDIGGGFTPDYLENGEVSMKRLQKSILGSIETIFPCHKNEIEFIAEPGRFFAESSVGIYTPVYSKRIRQGKQEYWIMEGMYGAFNCIIYDHQIPSYYPLRSPKLPLLESVQPSQPATIWGPTCDSFDRVFDDAQLPSDLRIGDYIFFPHAGAYTLAGACDFNGIAFTRPKKYIIR